MERVYEHFVFVRFIRKKKPFAKKEPLRGAWRDHRFPEPFSWFLHETGLESLKITSAHCFLLKCQRKVSKKAKEHRQFRGVLGRWRTAAIDHTTFHACQRCRKTAVFAVFSRLWGVIWRGKAFRDQQCQFLTRNKSLSIENESTVWEIPRSRYTHVTGRRRMSAVVFACSFEELRLGHTFGSMRAWQPKCGCSETDLLFAETFI